MEFQQLVYFKEVAQLESFSRAAEHLHITQSALSKSIAKLEQEIGVRLFTREGNSIHLNQFGKTLLRYADQALVNLESGLSQVRDMAGLACGAIRVGVSAEVFIKHLVRDFLLKHPDVSLTCLLQSPEQMSDSLLQGTVDFCIATAPVPGSGIVWQPLYEDHLTMLLPTTHPLAQRESAFLDEFSGDRFIITNLGYGMRSNTYELCQAAGFEPKVLYEGYDTEIAGQLIDAGLGVEVTPHSVSEGVARFLAGSPPPSVVKLPLVDSFSKKTIGLMATKGHYQSSAALAFYADVVEYFSSLI